MTDTSEKERRETLHNLLDSLLDERARIEVRSESALSLNALLPDFSGRDHLDVRDKAAARRLFQDALLLARRVVGPAVRDAALPQKYEDGRGQRKVVRNWIFAFLPLLDFPARSFSALGQERHLPLDVIEGLSALDAGEIQPLFLANTGKARRANRYSLARRKMEALFWKKRLMAIGLNEKSANYEITKAFGEQWDTIRKWRTQCEEILGEGYVRWGLEQAGTDRDPYLRSSRSGMFGNNSPEPERGLEHAGQNYRAEVRRAAELSKRKTRSTQEK